MSTNYFSKNVDDTLDYKIDYAAWLETGDTISSSTWALTAGVVQTNSINTISSATIFISGGTQSVTYSVINTITTVQGLVKSKSIVLYITPSGT